jgi:hypothetical protein
MHSDQGFYLPATVSNCPHLATFRAPNAHQYSSALLIPVPPLLCTQ